MKRDCGFLHLPLRHAVSIAALSFSQDARRATKRFDDPRDSEAIHDFRVALRRLHSFLRAYRPYTQGGISKTPLKEIKHFVVFTNRIRDTEVQIKWLLAQHRNLKADEMRSRDWLLAALEGYRDKEDQLVRREVTDRFNPFCNHLQQQLKLLSTKAAGNTSGDFIFASRHVFSEYSLCLKKALKAVKAEKDIEKMHQARIAEKRLRYFLEPLEADVAGCSRVILDLVSLQRLLGEMHDLQMLELTLRRQRKDVPAGLKKGFRALMRRGKLRHRNLYAVLHRKWLGVEAGRFFRGMQQQVKIENAVNEKS